MNTLYQLEHLTDAIRFSSHTDNCPWRNISYLNIVVNPRLYGQIAVGLSDWSRHTTHNGHVGFVSLEYMGVRIVNTIDFLKDEEITIDYKVANFISENDILMPKMRMLYVLARMRASKYSSSVMGLVE